MYRSTFRKAMLPAAVSALLAGLALPVAAGEDDEEEIPFDEAAIFFELNDTDGDLGIHAKIDGGPWKKLEIEDHREREILDISVKGRLRRQGLTEIFFESAEPPFESDDPEDEVLTPERFFKRFPEGTYEIEGVSLDGEELESEVELTHLMPAPPDNLRVSGVAASEDCDENVPLVGTPVVISWDQVTLSHPDLGRTNEPIEVDRYQVVVEQEDLEVVLSVDLPPDVTMLEIPAGFIALGEEFKYEVVVREESGNQTAIESCFAVD